MNILSREEALSQGLKRYFTGEPCSNEHVGERRTSDKICIECASLKSQRRSSLLKDYHQKNKDRAKANAAANYQANKDAYKARARKWEKDNPERSAELQREWRRSEKGLEQSRRWTAANKEAHAARVEDWRKRNPGKSAEYVRTRQLTKKSATPPWVTKEMRAAMRWFYQEAKRIEATTGVKQHVDHIIPIQGKEVCGLHLPGNLQILSETENARKGTSWDRERAEAALLELARSIALT